MRQTVRLGRIGGIPIGVHWSVLIITLLLTEGLAASVLPATAPGRGVLAYWLVALLIAIVFLASLLAHELSHAFVARHYGMPVRRITLWLLGGVSELEGEAPHPKADLLIALAGPLASAVSGGVFAGLAVGASSAGLPRLVVASLAWLAVVNGLLAAFNLLPGAPLDGGRVLRAILWRVRGDRAAAQRGASRAGVVLGVLLLLAGLAQLFIGRDLGGLWLVLLGWFLMAAANAERADVGRQALDGVQVAQVMRSDPVCGYEGQSIAVFVDTVARHSPHRTFPVVNFEGECTGLVSLSRLGRVPPPQRDTVRLREVCLPLARVSTLTPEQSLTEAVPLALAGRHRLLPVLAHRRPVGVLSTGDATRMVELAALGAPIDAAVHPVDVSRPGT